MDKKQIIRLATILGIGAITGPVAIAAAAGYFKLSNVLAIAFGFISGPAAIIKASLLKGEIKERIFSAIIAGIIATFFITISAGFGPKVLDLFNINILKIFGGISVIIIGFIIMGITIPESSPFIIILIGLILGVIFR